MFLTPQKYNDVFHTSINKHLKPTNQTTTTKKEEEKVSTI